MQAIVRAAQTRAASTRFVQCIRTKRLISLKADGYPQDLEFYPDFFSPRDQRVILSAALGKLDKMESIKYRRRRKEYLARLNLDEPSGGFFPDEFYRFEQGHFDSVITNYREMHVSSWPEDNTDLSPLIERLHSVHPKQETQTHILHLASNGKILPHVDNLGASGSWILGLVLGSTRVLRFEHAEDSSDAFEMLVPSGCVYIQRDSLRYHYKHAVLGSGNEYGSGQRLSIMIRDKLLG